MTSDQPEGPFKPDPDPIPGSLGGIWGGQLQCYSSPFDASQDGPHEPSGKGVKALCARYGKLKPDMRTFDGDVGGLVIVDESGQPLWADDHDRRFFEASWMHKRNGVYYFSYSTGDTHYIVYATSKSLDRSLTEGGYWSQWSGGHIIA